jgi:hypothetical protein
VALSEAIEKNNEVLFTVGRKDQRVRMKVHTVASDRNRLVQERLTMTEPTQNTLPAPACAARLAAT